MNLIIFDPLEKLEYWLLHVMEKKNQRNQLFKIKSTLKITLSRGK